MQIVINNNNEILAYATVGNLVNGINANIEIPSDFAPSKYLLVSTGSEEEITYSVELNPNYVQPEEEIEVTIDDLMDAISILEEMVLGEE